MASTTSARRSVRGAHRGDRRFDAVSLLTIFLVLLLAIESRLVIAPIGGAGAPAQLVCLGCLGWWVYHHVQRTDSRPWSVQPVRIALFAMFLAFTASYVAAMSRPISGDESSVSTLGMVAMLGWVGLGLLANDGITDEDRLETIIRRLVIGTTAVAVLGIAQFIFQDPLIRWISIPGLVPNLPLSGLGTRSGFVRPAGTTLHPIEFGAVLSTVLPLAIARARTRPPGQRLGANVAVCVIAIAIVICGSRSALVSTLVGLAVLAMVWSATTKLMAAAAAGVLVLFVGVTMPGMAGTLVGLFTGFSEDGSVKSRTDSYTIVGEFFGRQPWFGRGYSTFLPSYRILDNQYLLLLVEVGIVGLAAFLLVLGTAFWSARAARIHSTDPVRRERAQALAAGIAAAAIGFGTYDGLSFPTGTGILFLVVGIAGATWRLAREDPTEEPTTGRETG